jgi:hypothetical protein
MYKFSEKSKARLAECHPDLQKLFNTIIKYINIGITCGKRTMEEQKILVAQKKSKTLNSRHISKKDKGQGDEEFSRAVDIVWYDNYTGKYCWSPTIYRVIGPAIVQVAKDMGIELRWGGDWDQDGDMNDQTFMDLVHFEVNK